MFMRSLGQFAIASFPIQFSEGIGAYDDRFSLFFARSATNHTPSLKSVRIRKSLVALTHSGQGNSKNRKSGLRISVAPQVGRELVGCKPHKHPLGV